MLITEINPFLRLSVAALPLGVGIGIKAQINAMGQRMPVATPIQLAALTKLGYGWFRCRAILAGKNPSKTIVATNVTMISPIVNNATAFKVSTSDSSQMLKR